MMPSFPTLREGDPISASLLRQLLAEVQRISNLTVESPLQLSYGPDGYHIRINLPQSTPTILGRGGGRREDDPPDEVRPRRSAVYPTYAQDAPTRVIRRIIEEIDYETPRRPVQLYQTVASPPLYTRRPLVDDTIYDDVRPRWISIVSGGGSVGADHSAQLNSCSTATVAAATGVADTTQILSWGAPSYDTDSFYSAGSPTKLTVPNGLAGKYLVYGGLALSTGSFGSTLGQVAIVQLLQNSSVMLANSSDGSSGNGGSFGRYFVSVCGEINLAVGDSISLQVLSSVQHTLTVASSSTMATMLGLRKIDKAG